MTHRPGPVKPDLRAAKPNFHFPDFRLSLLKKVSILNFDGVTVKTTSNCKIFVSPEGPETSTPLFMNARLMWRTSLEEKQT